MKFHTSVAKWLKLKVRKFFGLIPTFTGEKLGSYRGNRVDAYSTHDDNFLYNVEEQRDVFNDQFANLSGFWKGTG